MRWQPVNPEGVGFCCAFAIPPHPFLFRAYPIYFHHYSPHLLLYLKSSRSQSSHSFTRRALPLDLRYPLSSTIFPSLATSTHSFGTVIIDQYLGRMTPCH